MTRLSDAIEMFKGLGWSRNTIKRMFGQPRSRAAGVTLLPKGYKAKKRRKKKISKESKRRNRR